MNIAMGLALTAASIGAIYAIWTKLRWPGIAIVVVLALLAVLIRPKPEAEPEAEETAASEDDPGGAEEA